VSTEDKLGTDAGELAGLDVRTGIVATAGMDQVLATAPDCLVYCAMGDTRPVEATRDVTAALAAGINVVGSAPGGLQFPWTVLPDKAIRRVQDAALQGNSTVFITGVDPGFATDLMPFALAGTCQRIEQIRTMEIADYATYDGEGGDEDRDGLRQSDGSAGHAPAAGGAERGVGDRPEDAGGGNRCRTRRDHGELRARSRTRGHRDRVRGDRGRAPWPRCASRSAAWVDGRAAVVVEHITRVREDLRPDWAQPAQPGGSYRVEITGEPSYAVDICPTSSRGDHNYAAILVAAGRIVNAIPDVVAAAPGIRTTLDMPLVTGKGVYRPAP
jgi:hypothetical protein